MKYLVSLVMLVVGFFVATKSFSIVRVFGHLDWAEQRLGPGGTYTAWKLIGVIVIFAGLYVLIKPGLFGL